MKNSRKAAFLAAAATLFSGVLLYASPAEANWAPTAIDDGCTITDIGPERVVIGVAPKRVQFTVETDCDSTRDMKWAVYGAGVARANHYTWFAACNYIYAGPSVVDCSDGGAGYLDPFSVGPGESVGNEVAGENTIAAYAFVDSDSDGYDDDSTYCDYDESEDCAEQPKDRDWDDTTFEVLRRSTFSTSLNAGPEPRRKGQNLNLSTSLYVANWDTALYDQPQGLKVKVQFRSAGQDWHSVATAYTGVDGVDFTTKAVRSGYWRLVFPGTDTLAASTSNTDYVKVNPARR